MVSAQVGIGTVTPNPDSALEVASTDKGLLVPRIALTGTTNAAPLSAHVMGMMLYNTATASDVTPGYYVNDGAKWVRMVDTTSEPWRNPDGTAAADPNSTDINYMNGNIGLGIAIPDANLHLFSDTELLTHFKIENTSSGDASARVSTHNDLGAFASMSITNSGFTPQPHLANKAIFHGSNGTSGTILSTGGGGGSSLEFYTNGLSDPNNEKMRITGVGNVGIGTTTPNEKLEVNGKVRVSDLTGADLTTDVIVTADAATGELKEGGTLGSLVAANETVTTMVQDDVTGIITYTDESAVAITADVVSTDANNAIKVGTDGGAYIDATGTIVFSAEYAGAALDADGTNNLGFMTSDNAGAGNSWMNYYEWYSAEATIQDYDVIFRFTLPNDFTAWDAANAIVIDYVTETGSTANNNFTANVYLESNAVSLAAVGTTANAAWSTVTISGGSLATFTAGATGVIVLKMSSVNNNFVRLGDITLNYTK